MRRLFKDYEVCQEYTLCVNVTIILTWIRVVYNCVLAVD